MSKEQIVPGSKASIRLTPPYRNSDIAPWIQSWVNDAVNPQIFGRLESIIAALARFHAEMFTELDQKRSLIPAKVARSLIIGSEHRSYEYKPGYWVNVYRQLRASGSFKWIVTHTKGSVDSEEHDKIGARFGSDKLWNPGGVISWIKDQGIPQDVYIQIDRLYKEMKI